MEQLLVSIGTKIHFFRKQSGLTIWQLSEMSGVDGGFINCIEKGKKAPSLNTLLKIAGALNIGLTDIFSGRKVESEAPFGHRLHSQLRALLNGKSAEDQDKLVSILRALNDRELLAAVFKILRKNAHTSRRLRQG